MATTERPARTGGIDKESLRRRYAEERDKRLRPDGNDQYVRIAGEFGHYLDDPHTPRTDRAPLTDHRTVVCVGGGFAGLVVGARLREAGVDVRIVEKGGDFGGTWYWNRYPGAQCDTASMVYMPLLEETGHMPTEKYVHGPEILEHCQRIGRQFGLYDDALFHTEVTELTWDEARTRWVIETNRGDRLTAQFVVMGTGPLQRAEAARHSRASARSGPLVPHQPLGLRLHRRRLRRRADGQARRQAGGDHRHRRDRGPVRAAPGQVLPGTLRLPAHAVLGRRARQPPHRPGLVRRRRDARLAAALAGELHRQPVRRRTPTKTSCRTAGPTSSRRVRARIEALPPDNRDLAAVLGAFEESDFEKMEEIRARVEAIVRDRETAQKLKAWYRQLCKRPCFHDEYLQAFNNPATHLVDTDGKGVRADHRDRRRRRRPASTSSTASSTRPASRSAPRTNGGPASRSPAGTAARCRGTGPRACAPCTASTSTASRTF